MLFDRFKNLIKETKEAFYEGLYEAPPTSQEILDAYKLLGLSKEASFDEVKTQFKNLSKLYHPDTKTNSDPEQFIRIKAAYDVLKSHYQKQ